MCSRKTCLITFGVIIIVIAILVGLARDYMANVNPKKGGFILDREGFKGEVGDVIHNVLIVGGTNGIGLTLADVLVNKYGVSVTVVGRTEPKDLLKNSKAKFVKADLSSMKEARRVAQTLKAEDFDVLFFTVGIAPLMLERTAEGIESDLAVSYLSRHVIVHELLHNGFDKARANSQKPRIFLVGGPGVSLITPDIEDINWENKFDATSAHMNTHLFNEAIVHHLANQYPSIESFALNPG